MRHRPGLRRVAFRAIATSAAAGDGRRFGAVIRSWLRELRAVSEPLLAAGAAPALMRRSRSSRAPDWMEPEPRRSHQTPLFCSIAEAGGRKPRGLWTSPGACRSSSLSCATHRPSAAPANLKVSSKLASTSNRQSIFLHWYGALKFQWMMIVLNCLYHRRDAK